MLRCLAALAFLAVMAGCAGQFADPLRLPDRKPSASSEDDRGLELAPATLKAMEDPRIAATVAAAPHIYLALQPNEAGPLSIVFAIDAGRDRTPENDPAIRLTPEDGKCNAQELRYYTFPAKTAQRPVFGPDEAVAGVTAKELPAFMAMAVTHEMLLLGRAETLEDTYPQNVCTRKLWERMIFNESMKMG